MKIGITKLRLHVFTREDNLSKSFWDKITMWESGYQNLRDNLSNSFRLIKQLP